MRNTIKTASLTAALTLSTGAWAQFDTQNSPQLKSAKGAGQSSEPSREGSVDVVNDQAEPGTSSGAGGSNPGTSHTVEKGDTLWDLSSKFLGSPWYWPKVWSYNPEIANPHWIYPGNLVRFFPTGEEVPTQVEVGDGPVEDVEPGQEIDDDDRVKALGQIGYQSRGGVKMRIPGIVTAKELEEAGVISGSFGETEMLSPPQELYIRFKKKNEVRQGGRYLIYRAVQAIPHPVGGTNVGYLTTLLGEVRVKRVSDKDEMVTAEILSAWDEIYRGDLIGPSADDLVRTVSPRANDKEMKAWVVGSVPTYLANYGEHNVLIVDKGGDDGVQVGNTFEVVRRQDSLTYGTVEHPEMYDEKFPQESVGTCMAFDVKSKATTCVLIRSIRDIVPGDRLEMKPSRGGGAARASR